MPFKAVVRPDHDLVVTVPHGRITDAELPAYYAKRFRERTLRPGTRELVDGRWIDTFDVSAAGQRALVETLSEHRDRLVRVRWGFIARDPVAFGMFRMFEAQKSELPFVTSVFRRPPAAADWLGVPEEALDVGEAFDGNGGTPG